MGHSYRAVQWNRFKARYDLALIAGVVLFIGAFMGISSGVHPEATAETLLIRGLGLAAIVLLHVILAIGPLARLDRRWLPLLYNRRHLGVTMATLALIHGGFSILQFHAFGDTNPIVSLFTARSGADSISQLPFQPIGAAALAILLLMAATSHDFWLANLTAPVWKALHMLVYIAYALVVLHVALGSLQVQSHWAPGAILGAGVLGLGALHTMAAFKGRGPDTRQPKAVGDWVDVGATSDVPEGRALAVMVGGERVAIFKNDGKLSALSGVCQHQNGPLAEGRIVDGLVVCPWHGFQYRPNCGKSPEPFHETVPTFRLEVRGGRVFVEAKPLPLGTATEPVPASPEVSAP